MKSSLIIVLVCLLALSVSAVSIHEPSTTELLSRDKSIPHPVAPVLNDPHVHRNSQASPPVETPAEHNFYSKIAKDLQAYDAKHLGTKPWDELTKKEKKKRNKELMTNPAYQDEAELDSLEQEIEQEYHNNDNNQNHHENHESVSVDVHVNVGRPRHHKLRQMMRQ